MHGVVVGRTLEIGKSARSKRQSRDHARMGNRHNGFDVGEKSSGRDPPTTQDRLGKTGGMARDVCP